MSQTDEIDEEFEFDVEESGGRKRRQVIIEQGVEAELCQAELDRRRRTVHHHYHHHKPVPQRHHVFSDAEATDSEEFEIRPNVDPRSPANYRDTPFMFPEVYTPAPTECTVSDLEIEKPQVSEGLGLTVPEAYTPPQMRYDEGMEQPVKETKRVPLRMGTPPDTPPMTPVDEVAEEQEEDEEDDDDEEGGVSMHEASESEEESEDEVVLPRIRPRSTSPRTIEVCKEECSESEEESTTPRGPLTRKVLEVPLSIPPGSWRVEVELVPPPPKKGSKPTKYKPKIGGRTMSSPVVQHMEIQAPIPRAPRSPRPDLSARTLSTPMIKETEIVPIEVPSPAFTLEIPESDEEAELKAEPVFRSPMWHADLPTTEGLGVSENRSTSRASSRLDVEIPSPTLGFEEHCDEVDESLHLDERSPSPKSFVGSVPRRVRAEVPIELKPVNNIVVDVPVIDITLPEPKSIFEPVNIPLPASPAPSFIEPQPEITVSPADIPLPATPVQRSATPPPTSIDDAIEKTDRKVAASKTLELSPPHNLTPAVTPAIPTPIATPATPAVSEPAPFPEDVIDLAFPPPAPFPEDVIDSKQKAQDPIPASETTTTPNPSIITSKLDEPTALIGLGLQLPTSSTPQPTILPPKRDPRTAPRKPHHCLLSGHLFVTHQSPQDVTCSRCQKKKPKKAWQCLVTARCGIVICDDCKNDQVTKLVNVKEDDRVVIKEETEIVWGRWDVCDGDDVVFVMGRVPIKKKKSRVPKPVVGEAEGNEAAEMAGMTPINVGDGKGSLRRKQPGKWRL